MQVFIPINIENFHWYLAIVNAKKNEVHILDSMGPQITDRRDLYTTVSNYSLYIYVIILALHYLLSFNLKILFVCHIVKRSRKTN
jgi:Ulp1 family protease